MSAAERRTCDVLVVGSGAGGLTAALTAAAAGLDVMLIEKTPLFGGTTAHSEGMIWVPLSPHAVRAGREDSADAALTYLSAVAGNHLDAGKAAAYLQAAPAMLRFVEAASRVRYSLAASLDYYSDKPGATAGARSLRVEPMDGRTLGPVFGQVRPPLRSTLAFGGMTITGADLPDALRAHRSVRAFARMARLTACYAWDRARGYPRGTRIANGHAVVACLVEALVKRGVRMVPDAALQDLVMAEGRVAGAVVSAAGTDVRVAARMGVVLAAGGFSNDAKRKAEHFDHVGRSHAHALLASEASTGNGIGAAIAAGAAMTANLVQPAAWTPASLVPQRDGSVVAFPHYVDRNKPGFIAVDATGRRFANEATGYAPFTAAMVEACRGRAATEAWLVADARAVDRYGIGAAPPFPPLLAAAVRSGYLTKARTLGALAAAIGIPADALLATVAAFNDFARAGHDPDFRRGGTAYERAGGDPAHAPNPSLGPLEKAPFYAVRIIPSDIGTFAGLRTDEVARVLTSDGSAIPGLYAVGNDAASAFGGTYPAAGITVGLAMTFGYVAGQHLAAGHVAAAGPTSSMAPVT